MTAEQTLFLPQGTQLNQYTLGKLLYANGESAVYAAEDDKGRAFRIREFLPQKMVSRDENSLDLIPSSENQTIYKYSLAAFEELFRPLCCGEENKLEFIQPVEEIFYANNSVYVVKSALDLPTLQEYAAEKGEAFTWTEAKKRLLPLMNSISRLHEKNVIHLGISPENLYVDGDRLILAGFATLEARTADGELDNQLYSGFSAPEQYQGGDWKGGTWSDVYALGALLYWMLTGEIPPSADSRLEEDTLLPAMEKNPSVPENVSDAISGALMTDSMLRSATVDDFTSALLESVSGNTTVYEVPDIIPSDITYHLEAPEETEKPKKHRTVWKILFASVFSIVMALLLAIMMYSLVSDRVLSKPSEDEQNPQEQEVLYTVPDFVGHKFDDIRNNGEYKDIFVLNPVLEYSDSYPAGVIIDQSEKKGTQLPQFGTIVLTVSQGKETRSLPNLIGYGLAAAKATLDEMGIPYSVYTVENSSYTPNTVFRTDPPEGTAIAASDDTVVKIYVTPEKTQTSGRKPVTKKD